MKQINFKSVWFLSTLSALILAAEYFIGQNSNALFGLDTRNVKNNIILTSRVYIPAVVAILLCSLIAITIYILNIIAKLKRKENIKMLNWISILFSIPGIIFVTSFLWEFIDNLNVILHSQPKF
jgi:hypothetical protein